MEEFEQLRLWEEYEPQVNDYVIWDQNLRLSGDYGKDEGWVYFKCDEYITIETGVRPKPHCKYDKNSKHAKIHTLLVCHSEFWQELKYVKRRESKYG